MTDFQINDRILQKECDELAAEIIADFTAALAEDETLADKRDEMSDRAHETADSHEWVIYNYKALMICAHCNTDQGDEFLEDVGMPETPTLHSIACMIAFGEMRARIEGEIDRLIEEQDVESDAA